MPQGMGTYGSKVGRPPKKKAHGGSLKAAPAGNAGLGKLPTEVRNNMGYMAYGGKVKKWERVVVHVRVWAKLPEVATLAGMGSHYG